MRLLPAFNRTSLELKRTLKVGDIGAISSFNRTSLELKRPLDARIFIQYHSL